MYAHWRTEALKNELRRRGASLKGRKADLAARLESYDHNQNFDAIICEPNEDERMVLPDPGQYKDINSSRTLPAITKENITLYFWEFHNNTNQGKLLYETRYLNVLRSASGKDSTYFKGLVKATMKQLLYEVNIKVNPHGGLEETSCECVAGSGTNAHCKHVAVVLCALVDWTTNKTIIKSQTCTDKLQTFHKPKKTYTESPIQARKLITRKRKQENINFEPYKGVIDESQYNAKVRSIILNWNTEIPFKQCFAPANPYGIENDHSYNGSIIHSILKDLKLEDIKTDELMLIEHETRGQSQNEQWKEYRKCRITSSDFYTICHLRDTTKQKFAEQLLERSQFRSRATTHGLINEKVAFEKYKKSYGLRAFTCGLYISHERPYLGASPDGLLGEETIIEIKCPYASRNLFIDNVTVPYLYKDENNQLQLKTTCPYFYQVQGQLYCTNRQYCNFIIYSYKDMKVVFVNRDNDFIKNMLVKLDFFYVNFFKDAIINKYFYKNYDRLIQK